tara:strand:- start:139 stop:642 length:504 start_codon:yes stop_codon:yes gene_type:complete
MLLELPDELLLGCICESMRICVKLSNANNYLRIKLQQLAAAHGLRLVTVDVRQAFWIKRQLRGKYYVSTLVLTDYVWSFIDWTLLAFLYTNFDKLHTVCVNPQHADEVTELYTNYTSDSAAFKEFKTELLAARESGVFTVTTRRHIKVFWPARQLKLTEMNWLLRHQ